MTLRLTVMMAETSRTSRVGAPGEDTHRSDPHRPGPATLPQPRAPWNNHPSHTGSSAPQDLLPALPCWLTLGSLFLSLHLTFLICKMGVSRQVSPSPSLHEPCVGSAPTPKLRTLEGRGQVCPWPSQASPTGLSNASKRATASVWHDSIPARPPLHTRSHNSSRICPKR